MSESFFSPDWPSVAQLKPRLRAHLRLHRQVYRERIWHIVEDETSGRQHRLDEFAWELVSRLDGKSTIDKLWEQLVDSLKAEAPSQPDVIQLIGSLHQSDLIQSDITPDTEELFYRSEDRKDVRRQSIVNPFAFKAPLFNPAKFLDRHEAKTRWMFHWFTGIVVTIFVICAAFVASQKWSEITLHAASYLPSNRFWIITWFVYPVVKFCHEMSHAFAVRRWGGKVQEIGISLLVLMPVPYVNASAASLFSDKHARMVVSAAGIIAEVVIASIALFVWLNISDGLIRDIAFVVMTISGLSTVLFNANPLIKFDGYHFLADWLEIPDLAKRSGQYWSWLSKHFLLKVPQLERMDLSSGEAKWLILYAPASWIYRWFILLVIARWMADVSLILAAVVAGYFLYSLLIKPLWKISKYLWQSSELSNKRARSLVTAIASLGILCVVITVVPAPFSTVTQAVVQAPDESRIRSSAAGFVSEVLVEQGETVEFGQPLIRLKNDLLLTRKKQLTARLAAIDARLKANQQIDRSKAKELEHESETVRAELALTSEQSSELLIRSQITGRIIIPQLVDMQGRYIRQGDTLGYVLGHADLHLRAAVNQGDFNKLNQFRGDVTAQLGNSGKDIKQVDIVDIRPAASNELPSSALGISAGGIFLTDPADEEGLKTVSPIFLLDLAAPGLPVERIGNRVWLRFDHGHKPLLKQWAIYWEQLLIQHFSSQA